MIYSVFSNKSCLLSVFSDGKIKEAYPSIWDHHKYRERCSNSRVSNPWWKVLFFSMGFLHIRKTLRNDLTNQWEMWLCRWKDVKHDNTVTWLAFWNDPINPRECKYVFLGAGSALKGQSDKEKYEKARNLTVLSFSFWWSLCLLLLLFLLY